MSNLILILLGTFLVITDYTASKSNTQLDFKHDPKLRKEVIYFDRVEYQDGCCQDDNGCHPPVELLCLLSQLSLRLVQLHHESLFRLLDLGNCQLQSVFLLQSDDVWVEVAGYLLVEGLKNILKQLELVVEFLCGQSYKLA